MMNPLNIVLICQRTKTINEMRVERTVAYVRGTCAANARLTSGTPEPQA